MTTFKISAPGRIVLSGQFGAMYGKRVVLASLNRRTKLEFYELSDEPRNIFIEFFNVTLTRTVSLEIIDQFFSVENFDDMISDHVRFLKLVQSLISLNGMWETHEQRCSLEIFFFLLLHYAHYERLNIKSFRVNLATLLPFGAGLGSSSSFAVCLSACFFHWKRLQDGDPDNAIEFKEEDLISISTYARLAEKVVLSYVFETDINVCCYGKIIESQYITPKDDYFTRIIDTPVMNILLVDLKVLCMEERARQIAEEMYICPAFVNSCLNSSDRISENICKALFDIIQFQGESDLSEAKAYASLQELIREYQDTSSTLNLSHRCLEQMCLVAKKYNKECVGTFAGYEGKYAYILLPRNIPKRQIAILSKRLEKKGFEATMESVSCNGLTID